MSLFTRVSLLLGALLFLAALGLPCVDTNFGELTRGFGTRGYQCSIGLFLMPITLPAASPIWLALLAGNLWAVLVVPLFLCGRTTRPLLARMRWIAILAFVACLVLTLLRAELGLSAIHSGYVLWAASLALVCLGTWLLWLSLPQP